MNTNGEIFEKPATYKPRADEVALLDAQAKRLLAMEQDQRVEAFAQEAGTTRPVLCGSKMWKELQRKAAKRLA